MHVFLSFCLIYVSCLHHFLLKQLFPHCLYSLFQLSFPSFSSDLKVLRPRKATPSDHSRLVPKLSLTPKMNPILSSSSLTFSPFATCFSVFLFDFLTLVFNPFLPSMVACISSMRSSSSSLLVCLP